MESEELLAYFPLKLYYARPILQLNASDPLPSAVLNRLTKTIRTVIDSKQWDVVKESETKGTRLEMSEVAPATVLARVEKATQIQKAPIGDATFSLDIADGLAAWFSATLAVTNECTLSENLFQDVLRSDEDRCYDSISAYLARGGMLSILLMGEKPKGSWPFFLASADWVISEQEFLLGSVTRRSSLENGSELILFEAFRRMEERLPAARLQRLQKRLRQRRQLRPIRFLKPTRVVSLPQLLISTDRIIFPFSHSPDKAFSLTIFGAERTTVHMVRDAIVDLVESWQAIEPAIEPDKASTLQTTSDAVSQSSLVLNDVLGEITVRAGVSLREMATEYVARGCRGIYVATASTHGEPGFDHWATSLRNAGWAVLLVPAAQNVSITADIMFVDDRYCCIQIGDLSAVIETDESSCVREFVSVYEKCLFGEQMQVSCHSGPN